VREYVLENNIIIDIVTAPLSFQGYEKSLCCLEDWGKERRGHIFVWSFKEFSISKLEEKKDNLSIFKKDYI